MNTLIVALLIALDLIPHGVPLISDIQSKLENKIKIEERQVANTTNEVLNFAPLPNKTDNFFLPTVDASAYEAVDIGTGEVMLEKNEDTSLEVASLTKLMTARLLLKDGDLNKIVTANDLSKVRSDDSKANIVLNDQFTQRQLLHLMLIDSASDAALTVANNLYSVGYSEFIQKMNDEAANLGMKNTHFSNPVGWDDSKNYSSAQDLQILTRVLLQNPEFKKVVATSSETVTSEKGYSYNLQNTNILLDGKTVFGVKTGTTLSAKQCLIASTKVNNRDVIFVILGANDRFTETKNLLSWANLVYNW